MKRFNLKVQTVSDIITNSSSEVFMVYDDKCINNIKELVNAILSINNTDVTFDDLFECKISFDKERLLDDCPEYIDLTEEELLRKAKEHDDNDYDSWPYINGVSITAKKNDKKVKDAAIVLSKIDEIFDSYAKYC